MGRVCMGRVCYGPSLSWAEFVMGRVVQLPVEVSFIVIIFCDFVHLIIRWGESTI